MLSNMAGVCVAFTQTQTPLSAESSIARGGKIFRALSRALR